LIARIARIKLYDIRTLEELQYDRRRNNRPNPQLNERTLAARHYCPVETKKILGSGRKSKNADVCQNKVYHENADRPSEFPPEMHVPFGLSNGWQSVQQRFDSVYCGVLTHSSREKDSRVEAE
jgi:hypothetical protein